MNKLKVLVACEFSSIVTDAFNALGHDAWSCDLIPCEKTQDHHIQGDVREILDKEWDLMIAHPPCTSLASSGARWFKFKEREQQEAVEFFMTLINAPIEKICIENPVGIMSSRYRKPDQIIQPYMFGDPYMKTTCLWLKNLPKLIPTNIVEGREQKCWKEPPGPNRWKNRSRTYPGVAQALAEQYGG